MGAEILGPGIAVAWRPQVGPQTALLQCECFEVFFGGARGGGKTDAMLGEFAAHGGKYADNAIGLMVRRTRTELVETIERSKQLFSPLGAKFHEQDKMWRFPNGARLRFAYLERDSDADAYQGHSYTRVYVEEAGTFPSERPILKLMATLRSGAGVPVGIRLTGNPGGPGQQWVKSRYIDPTPGGWKVQQRNFTNPFNGEQVSRDWVFIPSRVTDNAYLGGEYIAGLQMVGSAQLVKAWLEGDWNVVEGAFFDNWRQDKHVIAPFTIPDDWLRFRSMDWGSASPFSVGWWAVVGDTHVLGGSVGGDTDGIGRILPRGCLVRYREWYGAESPGKGLKLSNSELAEGIISREKDDPRLSFGVLDPSCFAEQGGPSIAEQINRALISAKLPSFHEADNKRIAQRGAMSGWDQMRGRLHGDADGNPMLVVFDTCRDFIRTIPVLQHDQDKPEDLDCWVAGTPVATPDGDLPIESIQEGDLVDTPIGPRRVLKAYPSGPGPTIRVKLSDGRQLEGTGHHKIYVEGKGLIALDSLQCYDTLIERNMAWQRRLLSIAASLTRVTRAGATTIQTGLCWLKENNRFTAAYGLMPGIPSLMGGTSTTSTATTTTTNFLTWSVCRQQRIYEGIQKLGPYKANANGNGLQPRTARQRYKKTQWQCGNARRDVNRRADIVAVLLALNTLGKFIAPLSAGRRVVISKFKKLAQYAGKSFGQSATPARKRRPAHIIAVGRSDERKLTYNLTVADAHLFYANGFLSSNTEAEDHVADEARYACMSRPWVRKIDAPEVKNRTGYTTHRPTPKQDEFITY